MIPRKHLDHFVTRYIERLPEKISDRREDLIVLLSLLPRGYSRRHEIMEMLQHIRAHEQAQLNFNKILTGGAKP